jgi:hypothetical protein
MTLAVSAAARHFPAARAKHKCPPVSAQLVFGELVCMFFLALHLRWKPYRDPSCDKLQFIVLVQLLITYSVGLLYHSDPEDASDAVANSGGDATPN